MAASATARRAPARSSRARAAPRRAPARRRAATARARRPQPVGGRLVPLAVGRTAVAVGGIADSGLVFRLTRGRLWIGVLATLLIGIVGLNVMALSFNASATKVAGQADGLNRANSALRAQVASDLSNEAVQGAADERGLIVPEPGAIRYLNPSPNDAAVAARRLAGGEFLIAPAPVELAPLPIEPLAEPVVDPAARRRRVRPTPPPSTRPPPRRPPTRRPRRRRRRQPRLPPARPRAG